MNTQHKLEQVVVGMEVYDNGGAKIGTVGAIYPGGAATKPRKKDIPPIVDIVSDILEGRKDLPLSLYLRLYREGFVHVRGSQLEPDAIISPSHIEKIDGNTIYLKMRVVFRKKVIRSKKAARSQAAAVG